MPNLAIVEPQPGDEITSAWGISVAEGMNGIQSGTVTATVTATSRFDYTLTYPRAYASPPTVLITVAGGNTYLGGLVTAPTGTSIVVGLFKRDGTALPAGAAIMFQWLAIGVPV